MFDIDLPLSPSANELFRTSKYGWRRFQTAKYRAWIKSAGVILQASGAIKVRGDVIVTISIPHDYTSDADNRIKAVLDLLVRHELIDDDRYVVDLRVVKDKAVPKKRCWVLVVADAGLRPGRRRPVVAA